MDMNITNGLNQGQKDAADAFFHFLMDSSQKYFIISGPGGTGKTYLMGHLIDQIIPSYIAACNLLGEKPKYDNVQMTAMTNKAAEVLSLATQRPVSTIHSLLELKVKENFKTGVVELIPTTGIIRRNEIIFIDEASMIDRQIRYYIENHTHNCKIIYVCDDKQLPPVKESLSGIFQQNFHTVTLTEPMRNATQPALMDICTQFRQTVETDEWFNIQTVPGVIDYATDEEMPKILEELFMDPKNNNRVVCYSNMRVIEFNTYIREMKGLPSNHPSVGERLINSSTIVIKAPLSDPKFLQTEEEVEVVELLSEPYETGAGSDPNASMWAMDIKIKNKFSEFLECTVPLDPEHFKNLLSYYGRLKDWKSYFFLKNTYPDLRPRETSTVHKAQGSSFDTVLIDVGNLSACHQSNLAARLFYVAVSRARYRIILYGDLAPKYGAII